jgi:hypothetical protein
LFLIFLASDAKKCRAYGRGIQPKGVRTGDVAEFRVITKDAGEGAMKATVTGPGRIEFFQFDLFSKNYFRWFGTSLSRHKSK